MSILIYAYLLALFFANCAFASPSPDAEKGTGVLVVTYHTGRNGERLDRVRFRLINELKEQMMYPRTGSFNDKGTSNIRRVTIPELPAGRYLVEFIAPNQDGLFGELPTREITIYDGEITKMDQGLKPHYGRVHAKAVVPIVSTVLGPTMRLCDSSGNCLASSQNGELDSNNLLPGKYTLFYDKYLNYIPPDPVHFEVLPGAVVGPFERHYSYYPNSSSN